VIKGTEGLGVRKEKHKVYAEHSPGRMSERLQAGLRALKILTNAPLSHHRRKDSNRPYYY
jgi:hypothetical protein